MSHLVPAYTQHRSLVSVHRLSLCLAPRADFIQTDLQFQSGPSVSGANHSPASPLTLLSQLPTAR